MRSATRQQQVLSGASERMQYLPSILTVPIRPRPVRELVMELCLRLLFSRTCQRLTAAWKGVGVVSTVVKLLKAAAVH